MNILALVLIGLVAGLIARALIPGHHSMGYIRTTLLGVAGSFVGGMLHSLLFTSGEVLAVHRSGLIASVVGSMLVLTLAGVARGRERV